MLLLIDASAAIKALVEEEDSIHARELFAGPSILVSPAHALGECAEVLVRKCLRSELPSNQVYEALALLQKSVGFIPIDNLVDQAVQLALDTGISAYDALYVAAARTLNCNLVTADQRLIRKLSETPDAKRIVPLRSSTP